MKVQRGPQYFTSRDGEKCVRIPLADSLHSAELLADDYDSLLEYGLSPNWFLNLNKRNGLAYVKADTRGDNKCTVARLVTVVGNGQQVRYRDGNRLNLRWDNLVTTKGGRAHKDVSELLDRLRGRDAHAQ